MKLFRFLATPSGGAYKKFVRSVLRGFTTSELLNTMVVGDRIAFGEMSTSPTYSAWALALTQDRRNQRVWDAIEPGDVAAFYVGKRFSHFAPILFKWSSESIARVARWGKPKSGTFSLAFIVDRVSECDLSDTDYCALMNYKGVPANSDYHSYEKSVELFNAMNIGIRNPTESMDDLDAEGQIRYRIQCFRERSEGNRLRVLERKGTICEACRFDFAAQYGPPFKPSAHVHHKDPVALGVRQARSIDEFAVLCGPCHTAVHMGIGRKLHPWSVEQMQGRILRRWDHLREEH